MHLDKSSELETSFCMSVRLLAPAREKKGETYRPNLNGNNTLFPHTQNEMLKKFALIHKKSKETPSRLFESPKPQSVFFYIETNTDERKISS